MPHCGTLLLLLAILAASVTSQTGPNCGALDVGVVSGQQRASSALWAATSDSSFTSLYVDRGTQGNVLSIDSDVTLTKPLVVGGDMIVQLGPTAVLTLLAQPAVGRRRLFSGAGQVRFLGDASTKFQVFPEWFQQAGDVGDSPALRRMGEACAKAFCTAIVSGALVLTEPWVLSPNVGVYSMGTSALRGPGAETQPAFPAVQFLPGSYYATQTYVLGSLTNFNTGMVATDVAGLRVYCSTVSRAVDAVVLKGAVADTSVTVFTLSMVETAFAFEATELRGLRAFTWFFVGHKVGKPAHVVEFRRAPREVVNVLVRFRAVDGKSKRQANGSVYLVRNSDTTAAVPNLNFRIESWGGNFVPTTKLVWGAFTNLQAFARMTRPYPSDMEGGGNVVNFSGLQKLKGVVMATKPKAAGSPILGNFAVIKLPAEALALAWPQGVRRDFYVKHSLLSGGLQRNIVVSPGSTSPSALSRGWVNPGLVVQAVVDESDISPNQLRIRLVNMASRSFPAGYFKGWQLDWRLYVAVNGVGLKA